MFKLAVLVSGAGTNLQAILDAVQEGKLPKAKVSLVISDKERAPGLTRAKEAGIKTLFIPKKRPDILLLALKSENIDLVVLAGYLSILPPEIVAAFKTLNVHPSLIPQFCGKGFYGEKVHKAVIESGAKITGATVHFVDSGIDTGPVFLQKTVDVLPDDTAQTLQKRVLAVEHEILVEALLNLTSPKINVLIVGSGGREHALGWKINQSPMAEKIFFAPGNGGTSEIGENIDIAADDIEKITEFAKANNIGMVVVGPEIPLKMGLCDRLREENIPVFGPDKKGAQLETSKAFAKKFMEKYSIPTASYHVYTNLNKCLAALENWNYPLVIKADGLAAGKGVIICHDENEAHAAAAYIMEEKAFGDAGSSVVVEEFLQGAEISLLCFTDGKTIVPMESAQDYKRAQDGDKGLNTGGMGCISPALVSPGNLDILENILTGIQEEGFDYRGVIYLGLIITSEGPKVLEFNARFGDPETEALMTRLESDLLEIVLAVNQGTLKEVSIDWREQVAVTVVLVSEGYPGQYETGFPIENLPQVVDGDAIFHGGTLLADGLKTSGGRVLMVTALGNSLEVARARAYEYADEIKFKNCFYRKDIGKI